MRRGTTWVLVAVGATTLAAAACTPHERDGRTPDAVESDAVRVEPPEPEPAVITILQTRDHEVTVYAADTELRFTVAASGGVVLATMLDQRQFQASFPGLYQRYDRAFAGERVGVDAGVDWIDASR